MTDNEILVGLVSILVLGIGAQWIGRRLNFPSLLLLLPAGLAAGATGIVKPEQMFGDTLFPLVTMLVALLLFQSGLDLRLDDLPRPARGPVVRLVTVGLAITFGGATGALLIATDVPTDVAFVTGAILTVSGPTVVGPLLKVIRPRAPTGAVLSWEGTVLDPLGATLGVVVLNLVLAAHSDTTVHPVLQAGGRLGLGLLVGLVGAAILVFVLSRFLLTDDMEAAVAVLIAALCFGVAEVVMSEAGLFATVTLGFLAANQRFVPTARIKGFGQTLEVLIIGTLFILLGSLVELRSMWDNIGPILIVVAILVLVVRPLSVGVSQIGSSLAPKDRALAGWMAPRGIVAAATVAQFAPTLHDAEIDSTLMSPIVFGVILGTGIIYGVTARPVAAALGVVAPKETGVALLAMRPWVFDLGRQLQDLGVPVTVLTTRTPEDIAAEHESLHLVSLVESERQLAEHLEEADIAHALVVTEPAAAVSLAVAGLVEMYGRRNVLVLPHKDGSTVERMLDEVWTPQPFAPDVTLEQLDDQVAHGARVAVCESGLPEGAVPLVLVGADGTVDLQPGEPGRHAPGTLIAMVPATVPA